MNKFIPILMAMLFSLTACTTTFSEPGIDEPVISEPTAHSKTATPQTSKPIPASTTPTPANSNLARGNVFLDSTELLTLESYPLQFTLVLIGNLPTPCDQLQVKVNPPDTENKILIDVYSVTEADKMCAQVLEPFEENFPLGSFPTGHYTLWVNGELVTEFDA